jgi:tRNA A-37 threonylcarbamoyl transferase component Bud32
MSNPYIYRGPVHSAQMFFGREHELREIVAFLNGNQSISVVGPRKIGKTSLLFHLMRTETWPTLGMSPNNVLVYLDCEVLGEGGHEEIFGTFAAEIAAALDERDLEPEPTLQAAIEQPTRISFERAVRKLNQRNLRIVLILDEFERLSTNNGLDVNFFNSMRSAAGRYQLAFITASAQPLIQLTYSGRSQEILSSPFFNIFAPLFLGLLPEDESYQAISMPAQEAGAPLPKEIQDFIYGLVGGFPLGIQVACFHAFEAMQSREPVDLYTIEQHTMQDLQPHFEYYWHNLSLSEQDTMRRVADVAERASSDTTLRAILRDLVQKCLLISESGVYRYPMRALANFINSQTMPGIAAVRNNGTLTGTQLGPYQVLEPIGHGGMAEVYKGRHPRLDRTVAIKVLPAKYSKKEDSGHAMFAQRFEREARAVAALRHSNIVQVFDFGDIEGNYYMVMEYIRGHDLAYLLRQKLALDLAPVEEILGQVASALDYAHTQGLVHRDVKPSNVLLENLLEDDLDQAELIHQSNAFRAVLTDFGIAKIFGADTAATQTGILMGTLDYMAPEQIRSAGQVDLRADIYALGVMAFQMLTGQVPFKAENPGAVMLSHLQTPPPDPRLFCSSIPDNVCLAIVRALQKNPDDRFSSAGEMIRAFHAT